jgi:hypothetical protein
MSDTYSTLISKQTSVTVKQQAIPPYPAPAVSSGADIQDARPSRTASVAAISPSRRAGPFEPLEATFAHGCP